jgi:biopolymer transport protein ExbD
MTSMMDILTVLLLFLLKSFVVEGEALTPVPGVDLPESSSEESAAPRLVVAVFDDAILVGDEMVASVSASLAEETLWIDGLGRRLEAERARSDALAQRRGADAVDEPAAGLAIQGDRNIEFSILQKVMYTCNRSGYDDIALAVIKDS